MVGVENDFFLVCVFERLRATGEGCGRGGENVGAATESRKVTTEYYSYFIRSESDV